MSIELLKARLDALDGEARSAARSAGTDALPLLLERAKDADPDQRSLAIECLSEIGGDDALRAVANALEDGNINVRSAALASLKSAHGPACAPKLIDVVARSPHAQIRGGAASILGTMRAMEALPAIKEQMTRETDSGAARAMMLAVARMEDGGQRQKILEGLKADSAPDRYQAIQELEYIGEPSLAGRLFPLLKDETRVVNVGIEQWPVWHRVCDRAVEAVASLTGNKFSFSVGGRTYTPPEIQEVEAFLLRRR